MNNVTFTVQNTQITFNVVQQNAVSITAGGSAVTFSVLTSLTNVPDYVVQYPAGEILGGHRAVVLDSSSKAVYASKDNLDHKNKFLGITTGAAVIDATAYIKTYGELLNSGWNWTLNQPVYLSTAGNLTQTTPTSGFILIVGFPTHATKLFIDIKQPIIIN